MLPIFKGDDQTFMLMQTKWKGELDPVLTNPLVSGILLNDQDLINGVTVINHGLGRKMQGWIIVDQNAAASIYRSGTLNERNLTLTSDAAVTVSLWMF